MCLRRMRRGKLIHGCDVGGTLLRPCWCSWAHNSVLCEATPLPCLFSSQTEEARHHYSHQVLGERFWWLCGEKKQMDTELWKADLPVQCSESRVRQSCCLGPLAEKPGRVGEVSGERVLRPETGHGAPDSAVPTGELRPVDLGGLCRVIFSRWPKARPPGGVSPRDLGAVPGPRFGKVLNAVVVASKVWDVTGKSHSAQARM